MIVDYLRTCYESDFLINETTGETIRGRYYWASPGASTYPDAHLFGSAVWRDPEEREASGLLGDQFTNVTEDDGSRPVLRPIAQRSELRGRLDCSGNPIGTGTGIIPMTDDTVSGLPTKCYRDTINQCAAYQTALNIDDRELWCWTARVIAALYEGSSTAEDLVNERIPNVRFVFAQLSAEGGHPQYIMWRADCGRGIILAGRTTAWQGMASFAGGANGPQPCDIGYTNPAFWAEAVTINAEFETLCGRHRGASFYAGHSYGGAIAGIMAARLANATIREEITVLGLGTPRLGNADIYKRLSKTETKWLANEGDPVPAFPPSFPTLTDLMGIVGAFLAGFWGRFAPPPETIVFREDGTYYVTQDWPADTISAETIATIFHERAIFPAFESHENSEYINRICPPVSWPDLLQFVTYLDPIENDLSDSPVFVDSPDPKNLVREGDVYYWDKTSFDGEYGGAKLTPLFIIPGEMSGAIFERWIWPVGYVPFKLTWTLPSYSFQWVFESDFVPELPAVPTGPLALHWTGSPGATTLRITVP
jgi:hypothetical protein